MAAAASQRYGCYVGNIDSSVPLETIRQVFSQCGTIMDASLNGRDTDPYRFGFIDFANEADRERALKFNGVVLAGRPLKVGVSKGNVNRPNADGTPSSGGRSHNNEGGISESTALLVQLVQSGAVNPANLTADQQRLLSGALLGMSAGGMGGGMPPPPAAGAPPMGGMPPPPMMPPQQMYNPMMPQQGGYGGYPMGGGYGNMSRPPRRGPPSANPAPSEELVMLRQAQKKTFFDVVLKEAERYQEKVQKRKNKRGGDSDSDSDSSSDDGDDRRRHSKERRRERSGDRDRRGHSGSRRDTSNDRRERPENSGERPSRTEDSRDAL